jgi:hypothetical protein
MPCEAWLKAVQHVTLKRIVRLPAGAWDRLDGMKPLPFQTGEELEALLLQVFLKAADPGPVRERLALAFAFHDPAAWMCVDGRAGGPALLSRGEAARRAGSDLTFRMSGEVAHAFWRGDLNVVAALGSGQLRIEGPLLRALALAPGLARIQAAYRAATGG